MLGGALRWRRVLRRRACPALVPTLRPGTSPTASRSTCSVPNAHRIDKRPNAIRRRGGRGRVDNRLCRCMASPWGSRPASIGRRAGRGEEDGSGRRCVMEPRGDPCILKRPFEGRERGEDARPVASFRGGGDAVGKQQSLGPASLNQLLWWRRPLGRGGDLCGCNLGGWRTGRGRRPLGWWAGRRRRGLWWRRRGPDWGWAGRGLWRWRRGPDWGRPRGRGRGLGWWRGPDGRGPRGRRRRLWRRGRGLWWRRREPGWWWAGRRGRGLWWWW